MWHGWADPQVPPQNSLIYYSNVLKAVGPPAEDSIALFMLPGVYHCAGGPGPDTFDQMGSIQAWVEQGAEARRGSWRRHQTAGKTTGRGPSVRLARWRLIAASAARTTQPTLPGGRSAARTSTARR